MSSRERRHRGLTGSTRSHVLAILRAADRPLGVREVAAALGLHPNSVREQLDRLVAAGHVERSVAPAAGRGRPALAYRTLPADDGDRPYRELARALADQLGAAQDPPAAAASAGDRWGRRVAGGDPPARDPAEATRRLARFLDDAGFAPERPGAADREIRLRRCPFADVVHGRTDVICGVHLGFMRGALRALEAPLDAVRLEPFVRPDLCVVRLGERVDA